MALLTDNKARDNILMKEFYLGENLKVCRLNYVQLEDDIGYIKSSHTDLPSSN